MDNTMVNLPSFKVIGISLRTSNKRALQDMPIFWDYFYQQKILEKIPNKKSNTVYGLYTDYESDYTGAYSFVIGAEVESTRDVPKKMVGKEIPKSKYALFSVQGKFPESLIAAWQNIWSLPLQRKYSIDMEVYQDAKNPNPEIFIAIE